MLKKFTRVHTFAWSWRLWENKVNIWHHDDDIMVGRDYGPLKESDCNKEI